MAAPQGNIELYRRLVALRHAEIVTRLTRLGGHAGRYEVIGPKAVRVWGTLGDGSQLSLLANLSPEPLRGSDRGRICGLRVVLRPIVSDLGPCCFD
jgi:hypothetical protein